MDPSQPDRSEPTPEPEPPRRDNPLFEELLWVHSMVRRDLEAVTRLAGEVDRGLEPSQLRDELDSLKTNGPLWQLKVNCLHYCRFVHHHHRLEDVAVFPALRRADPGLGPVIDRLEAEHREVATLLAAVEEAAEALADADGEATRARVRAALESLADTLLSHLAFEERELESALPKLSGPAADAEG